MKQHFSLLLILLSWKLAHGENETSLTSVEEEEHRLKESPIPFRPFGFRRPNRLQQIGGKPYPFPSPPHPFTTQAQEESTTERCSYQTTPSDLSTHGEQISTVPPTTRRPNPTKKRPPPMPPTSQSEDEEEGDGLVYSISRMDEDGGYFFDFLATNSVFRQEQGFFKANPDKKGEKIHVKTGAYGFTSPEGARVRIDYVADERGYRAFDTT